MTRIRPLVLLSLVLSLSACGFHLRSRIALPEDLGPVLVSSRVPYSQLTETIARGLQASGAALAPEDSTDVATLRIVSERWGDRPISIDQYGRSQEYSLRYAVIFVFQKADGTVLVPQQVIELSRDYVSQPNNVTGTTTEREILADELRREMAASILRRIDGVMRAGPAAAPPADGGTAAPEAPLDAAPDADEPASEAPATEAATPPDGT